MSQLDRPSRFIHQPQVAHGEIADETKIRAKAAAVAAAFAVVLQELRDGIRDGGGVQAQILRLQFSGMQRKEEEEEPAYDHGKEQQHGGKISDQTP